MLFTTFPQLVVLAVLFFGGIILGLGLHPGGGKWRRRFEDESDNYAQFRRDADMRVREANSRVAELERAQAALQANEAAARRTLSEAQARLAEAEARHKAEREAAAAPPVAQDAPATAPRPGMHLVHDAEAPVPPPVAEPAPIAGSAVPVAAAAAVPAYIPPSTPVRQEAEHDDDRRDATADDAEPAGHAETGPVGTAQERGDEDKPAVSEQTSWQRWLREPPPVRAQPAALAAEARPAPAKPAAVADAPAIPAPSEEPKKKWFSMGGGADDLGRIRGIDAGLKTKLFGLGVTRYEDITSLSALDEMALEQRLAVPAGFITREQWRDQAALLRSGQDAEHTERFARG